jgi:serine phosphatase RsbU (regulator of sigma subunit)
MKRVSCLLICQIFTFGFLTTACFAQENKIDSLKLLLHRDKMDTIKLIHFVQLSSEYEATDATDSSMRYGLLALKESQALASTANNSKIKHSAQISQMNANTRIGVAYEDEGNYPGAIKYYTASLALAQSIHNKKGISASYSNLGMVYEKLGNYSEALTNHFSALKIKEELGDKKTIGMAHIAIGNVYADLENYPDALANYFSALKISQELGYKKGIGQAYNNIGIIYRAQKRYPEALEYYFLSLKIKEERGDKKGIAAAKTNIGVIYQIQGNYTEALKMETEALALCEASDNKEGIAYSCNNIGEILIDQKKYREAEVQLKRSEDLARAIGAKRILKSDFDDLTRLDSARGNFKGAYENHKISILYRDSLDNEQTRKKTIQSQMTFDFEKKEAVATAEHKKEMENQRFLADEKSRKQKLVLALVVAGLLVVLLFSAFIFRSLRITRKQKHIIELQKQRVEEQKQEVEHQKLLVEEHQKEIVDSITYAKRLQQAILPSREEIVNYIPDSFILYKPKDIVAGDFYWLHVSHDTQTIFLAAADSTGHGVPGAMVSVVCSNALNRAVNEFQLSSTGQILDKTRELVLETFARSGEEIKDGMDISLIALNKASGRITWSGANNPLWYMQNNVFCEIKPDKQPIGKTDNPLPFQTHTIPFVSGTTFYLMTDGYADQFGGPKGKKYKYKQLQSLLTSISGLSPQKQREALEADFDDWKGALEQVDDVCLIGIRF